MRARHPLHQYVLGKRPTRTALRRTFTRTSLQVILGHAYYFAPSYVDNPFVALDFAKEVSSEDNAVEVQSSERHCCSGAS